MASLSKTYRYAITPPAPETARLHRSRLVDRLHEFLPRRLVLISAPPGYGKTALLVDFNQHVDVPICWVRLTRADQDEIRLASILEASLSKRFRRLRGKISVETFAGNPPAALSEAFIRPIDEFIDEPFVIAFDDIHRINPSSGATAFLDALVAELPNHVTVMMAGRELPEIGLSRWVVDAEVGGIGLHDLALTLDETRRYLLDQLELELDQADLTALHEATQGWITGVHLAGEEMVHARAGQIPTPALPKMPAVFDSIGEHLVTDMDAEEGRFLHESSVLPYMTAQRCDALLDRKDSEARLGELLRRGMFLTATETRPRSYEYHPLFRQFLLTRLADRDPDRLATLRRRAADQFAEDGSVELAFDMYLEVDDLPAATELAENSATELSSHGRYRTLERWWVEGLQQVKPTPANLALQLASIWCDQGRWEESDRLARRVLGELGPRGTEKSLVARAHNVLGLTAMQRGQYDDALKHCDIVGQIISAKSDPARWAAMLRVKGLTLTHQGDDLVAAEAALLEACDISERLGQGAAVASTLVDLSNIYDLQSRWHDHERVVTRAHEIYLELGAPLPLAITFNNLGYLAHIQGRFERALTCYQEGLRRAREAHSPRFEISLLYGQADLFSDLGLHLQAADLYGDGLQLATRLQIPRLQSYGDRQTAALHRRCGTYQLAAEWLQRARTVAEERDETLAIDVQSAGLEISEDPAKALDHIQTLLDDHAVFPRVALIALLHHFQASAFLAMSQTEEALASLESALVIAGRHSAEQALAGEWLYDDQLLRLGQAELGRHPELADVAQRVELMLAMARHYQAPALPAAPTDELRLTALGHSSVRLGAGGQIELEPLQRQVLFFVAEHQPVERDLILETFWPDSTPGRQVSSLYTAGHSLRRSMGRDMIEIQGSLYHLKTSQAVVYDAGEFDKAAKIALGVAPGDPRRLFALHQAIRGYGGAFLPEFDSEWVLSRRRELERVYLRVLSEHAVEAEIHGQLDHALESLRLALELEPVRDDLNVRYLELLGRVGRRSEIIAHYQKYVRRLADELGLDPPEATRQLYLRLIS